MMPAVTSAAVTRWLVPTVGGVALAEADESITPGELLRRANLELLRQAAIAEGLLAADDPPPTGGAISEAAADAIEVLLERALVHPTPDEATCQRFHAANPARYAVGEQVHPRHVLFAVTPGVDLNALRKRAEACLVDLRAKRRDEADRFPQAAAHWSNCPSSADGGDLGWLTAADCAPEFAREVFGGQEVGVLPRLVRSRFGLHVVEVLARRPGTVPSYDEVRAAVRATLERQAYATALRQYLQVLAGQTRLEGVDLQAATTPLVQ
jgi:peptidyl-prolyl cis-trans isomerase C